MQFLRDLQSQELVYIHHLAPEKTISSDLQDQYLIKTPKEINWFQPSIVYSLDIISVLVKIKKSRLFVFFLKHFA